jgi:hypothetical protein
VNLTGLTKEIVDAFRPEHGRTSCSDTNLVNGFASNGDKELPRCYRCALLEAVQAPYLWQDEKMRITLEIELIPWQPGDCCRHCGKSTDGPRYCGNCGKEIR